MIAPKLFVLVTLFTYGVSLSPRLHEEYFTPQVYAEEVVEKPSAGQTLPSPTPSPLIVPGDNWDEFVAAVDKVAPIYSFPKNVVLAQAALESARGSSRYAVERNNFLGINAVDSNPNLAYTFENPEQCVVEYMRIIRKNFPEAWANRDNPEALLKHLKINKQGMMYATDPMYVNKVMSMKEWNQ